MSRPSLALLGALVAGCAGSASSASSRPPPATAGPPAPALTPEMSRLEFYIGRWACHGTDLGDDRTQAIEHELVVEVTPKLDGSWLEVSVFEGNQRKTYELKGYDRSDRKFHHLVAAVDGGWGTLSSDGWHGEQMVFVDDHPAPGEAAARMVFEKQSDIRYTHRFETTEAGGGWKPLYTKDCDKLS